ncbi:MAG: glycoside hydrolase family 13 protein [Flavobacteriales bacterium]
MNKRFSLAAFLLLTLQLSAQVLKHVEPANWWVGMERHEIQVLLHGQNIANYQVEVSGLPIVGILKTENPNYLFVTLETKDKVAGTYPIKLLDKKKEITHFDFKLEERIQNSAQRESYTAADVIYLLMPDRFSNANEGLDAHPETKEVTNRSNPGGRHGGDIMGIIQHLNYIKELGATAIWTTPMLEDNEVTYSYHGYAQSDLYKIDPRYGTNSWYKEMVLEAHRQGLKVIKDEVPNHWSSKHWMIQDLPTHDWIHQFPSFTRSSYRTSTQMDPYSSQNDKHASEDGWFDTTMPDMNQSNPLLLTYLIQNTIWWIEYAQLDGLRVDTYSYNDKEAISIWTKAITDEYPKLNIMGEVWLHNQAQISYWQKNSPIGAIDSYNSYLPTVMDFTLQDAMMQAFNEPKQDWDKGMVRFYDNFTNDFLYQDPSNILVFMENHDTKRFNEYCPNLEDYKLALSLISTTRGIPQIYYGSEIGMKGSKDVGDADIRRDFPGGWAEDKHTGFCSSEDVKCHANQMGRTPEEEAYFQFTKTLLNWRKNNKIIHEGKFMQFVPENNVYVYARYEEPSKTNNLDSRQVVLVLINNSSKEETIRWDRFQEMIHGKETGVDVVTHQTVNFDQKTTTIPAKTAYILELK